MSITVTISDSTNSTFDSWEKEGMMIEWLTNNIGPRYNGWNIKWDNNPDDVFWLVWFHTEEHATAFLLRWG